MPTLIHCLLNGATARLMRRGAAYVRFPLNCHTTSGSFQRDSAGAGHSCHRFRLHDMRASSTFSGPVRRSWVAGIVSFHSHRNLQDLNLRSLPLSVKRRIPPHPRFRMPPSFRGVSSVAFGAHCLMPVKGDVAAWRAQPSGPDVWADALVRRMYPGKRRG